jgi:hypothetical protein
MLSTRRPTIAANESTDHLTGRRNVGLRSCTCRSAFGTTRRGDVDCVTAPDDHNRHSPERGLPFCSISSGMGCGSCRDRHRDELHHRGNMRSAATLRRALTGETALLAKPSIRHADRARPKRPPTTGSFAVSNVDTHVPPMHATSKIYSCRCDLHAAQMFAATGKEVLA